VAPRAGPSEDLAACGCSGLRITKLASGWSGAPPRLVQQAHLILQNGVLNLVAVLSVDNLNPGFGLAKLGLV
jgi:hypothetical protein